MTAVRTIGHGAASAAELVGRLDAAGLRRVVDVRAHPGSRRHPQFGREAMRRWLDDAGVAYAWVPELGGRRDPAPGSRHPALPDAAFRAYADHMATPAFRRAIDALLVDAAREPTAVLCSESAWRRCHRSLIADHLVLVRGVEVVHVGSDGTEAHVVTDGARVEGDAVVYDLGVTPPLLG